MSYRVLPRVLGRLREAQAHAERTAAVSLASVTDNPVFLPRARPTARRTGIERRLSQRPRASLLDALAHSWADVAQLAQRHIDKLFQHPVSAPPLTGEWLVKPLHMVGAGYAEEARSAAQTTMLGLGGFGQNDLPSPVFLAWGKATAAGDCLERILAVLAPSPPSPPRRGANRAAGPRTAAGLRALLRSAGRHSSPAGHRRRASGHRLQPLRPSPDHD